MWHGAMSFCRGILALFFRSLRTESRSLRMHLLWFVLMLVIYTALWFAREVSGSFGAPGLMFFRYIMYLNATFITLLGLSFFSTVISEEKEEDTLGLMTMAGIGTLGILLGKSTSRLFQVSLLLAIQYPFTLLAVTMGGLLPTQIFSAYMSLLAYTILLANVGLLCSVACRTNRNASGLTTFWLLGYLSGPAFAYAGMRYLIDDRGWSETDFWQNLVLASLSWTSRSTILLDLYEATETGHVFTWSPQIVGNGAGGLVCFLLAWWLFGIVAKDPSPETSSRGIVSRSTSGRLRWFSAGRTWNQPLIWKDFFFTTGGWAGVLVRIALYAGLYLLCYSANRPWYAHSSYLMRWEDVTWGFQSFAHPLLAIDIALCVSRVFQEEIKGQTLSSLLMLPQSIPSLVYSKLSGCVLAMAPGLGAMSISILLLPGGTAFVEEQGERAWFWWWIMNLVLMIHLTMVFSLYLRSGAFVLAVTSTIGTMIVTAFVIESGPFGRRYDDELFAAAAVGLAVISLSCHAILLLRVPVLGQR